MTLVRATLSALAEASGLDGELIDDLKTAVSEACNNVVLHAYPGDVGPLILSVISGSGGVNVTVEDRGTGIRHVAASDERMGVGLAVISALADRAEFQSGRGGGTLVRMSFKRGDMRYTTATAQALPDIGLIGDVVLWLSPASSLATVLGRLIRAVAATSHFTLGAVSDLHAVSAALGAYTERHSAGGPIGFSINASPRRLQLTGGPFPPLDGADAELERAPSKLPSHGQLPGAGQLASERELANLATELRTVHGTEWDLVQIEIVDHSRDLVDKGPRP
jgi:anti-sigma regulatory factor (Ser/Thr protein kinase)